MSVWGFFYGLTDNSAYRSFTKYVPVAISDSPAPADNRSNMQR